MEHVVFLFSILIWVLCPIIVGLILLQGAAGDISSSFGGGGMLDSTLGVGAHRKMAKATGILAGIFFIMILVLAFQHQGSFAKSPIPAGSSATPGSAPPAEAPVHPAPPSASATVAAPVSATVPAAIPVDATAAAVVPAPATSAVSTPEPATVAAPVPAPAPATVAAPAPATAPAPK